MQPAICLFKVDVFWDRRLGNQNLNARHVHYSCLLHTCDSAPGFFSWLPLSPSTFGHCVNAPESSLTLPTGGADGYNPSSWPPWHMFYTLSQSTLSRTEPHWPTSLMGFMSHIIGCLSFPVPFLHPLPVFPGINSQINYLHSNAILKVYFWSNPNQIPGKI